jgi:hypothetical protein
MKTTIYFSALVLALQIAGAGQTLAGNAPGIQVHFSKAKGEISDIAKFREQAKKTPILSGVALQKQANAELAAEFQKVAGAQGAITQKDAQSKGLGYVAKHFNEIDKAGAGAVTAQKFKQYLDSKTLPPNQ